jgi:GNAT superfamily N-acetyltransferase
MIEMHLLRTARYEDIAAMHRVRMSVRENRLVHSIVTEADYAEAIGSSGRGWLVEVAGDVVAFGVGTATTGNVWALFVHPAHEGRGYGRCLHDRIVAWLWSKGLERIWLTTTPGTRAQRFYETAGWFLAGPAAGGEVRYEMRRDGAKGP